MNELITRIVGMYSHLSSIELGLLLVMGILVFTWSYQKTRPMRKMMDQMSYQDMRDFKFQAKNDMKDLKTAFQHLKSKLK